MSIFGGVTIIKSLFLLILVFSCCLLEASEKLIVNMENVAQYPPCFRMSSPNHLHTVQDPPSLVGLDTLKASASGQFSERSLKKILKKIPSKNIKLVDLRQESHGYLNGNAVCWYGPNGWSNVGKTTDEVRMNEQKKLKALEKEWVVLLFNKKNTPSLIFVHKTETEAQLAKRFGVGYHRFGVTDHLRPYDHDVDEFVNFVKETPKDIWLHFHCSAGKGRGTTFITMYDIMRNSQRVSLDDIIRRQDLIGGKNLLAYEFSEKWKHIHAKERALFIQVFYEYCQQNPTFSISWTTWLQENHITLTFTDPIPD